MSAVSSAVGSSGSGSYSTDPSEYTNSSRAGRSEYSTAWDEKYTNSWDTAPPPGQDHISDPGPAGAQAPTVRVPPSSRTVPAVPPKPQQLSMKPAQQKPPSSPLLSVEDAMHQSVVKGGQSFKAAPGAEVGVGLRRWWGSPDGRVDGCRGHAWLPPTRIRGLMTE